MIFKTKKTPEVSAAQAVLQRRGDLEKKIDQEAKALAPLVEARDAATQELNRITAEDGSADAQSRAAARVKEAASKLDASSGTANYLRDRLASLGGELCRQYDALAGWLPEHNAELVRAFTAEWEKASAAFAVVLGKRRAIETLIGEPLMLADPAPASVDLDTDPSRPATILKQIREAITLTASMREQYSSGYGFDPQRAFDAQKSYKLLKPASGFAAGAVVVDAMLEPGRLESLVKLGEAVPPQDSEAVAGIQTCWTKRREIERAEAEEQQRKSAARQKARDLEIEAMGGVDYRPARMYPDLPAEERAKRLRALRMTEREKEEAERAESEENERQYREKLRQGGKGTLI